MLVYTSEALKIEKLVKRQFLKQHIEREIFQSCVEITREKQIDYVYPVKVKK